MSDGYCYDLNELHGILPTMEPVKMYEHYVYPMTRVQLNIMTNVFL